MATSKTPGRRTDNAWRLLLARRHLIDCTAASGSLVRAGQLRGGIIGPGGGIIGPGTEPGIGSVGPGPGIGSVGPGPGIGSVGPGPGIGSVGPGPGDGCAIPGSGCVPGAGRVAEVSGSHVFVFIVINLHTECRRPLLKATQRLLGGHW